MIDTKRMEELNGRLRGKRAGGQPAGAGSGGNNTDGAADRSGGGSGGDGSNRRNPDPQGSSRLSTAGGSPVRRFGAGPNGSGGASRDDSRRDGNGGGSQRDSGGGSGGGGRDGTEVTGSGSQFTTTANVPVGKGPAVIEIPVDAPTSNKPARGRKPKTSATLTDDTVRFGVAAIFAGIALMRGDHWHLSDDPKSTHGDEVGAIAEPAGKILRRLEEKYPAAFGKANEFTEIAALLMNLTVVVSRPLGVEAKRNAIQAQQARPVQPAGQPTPQSNGGHFIDAGKTVNIG